LSASSRLARDEKARSILIPLQIILFTLIATAMVGSCIEMHRRNHRSWPAIVGRMSPESRGAWGAAESVQPDPVKFLRAKSPWAAFRDAGVLMEMADYAERHAVHPDPVRVHAVRISAIQLRFAAAGAIIRHARLR
jgi:hypothetical protein